jgi:integrase
LLLFTGCRLNEVLTLRWDDVDLEHAVLHLRDAKAGPRDVPLGGAAIGLLDGCDRDGEWVIPSPRRKGSHLANLSTFWHEQVIVEEAANLPAVRLHDLRHTVGSVGAGAGLSMLMIGTVLGHRQTSTTERYSHVARGPLHDAADRISSEISAAMNGTTAKVRNMDTGGRKKKRAAK